MASEAKFVAKLPEDTALHDIIAKLAADPRGRCWVIGEVVRGRTVIDHPEFDDDQEEWKIEFRSITGVADPAKVDQLEAMAKQARARRPGQQSMAYGDPGD